MHYENRQPKEGVNVTRHNPLVTLFKLLVSAIVLVVIVVLIVNLLGGKLARFVPYRFESAIMQRVPYDFSSGEMISDSASTANPERSAQPIELYLRDLAQRVLTHMPFPEGMDVTLHYNADEVFNAFATLDGNVVFYRGLLQQMPHENALAMVMAHEMAHVLHRDPIAGLGGGIASMAALSALAGGVFNNSLGGVLNQTGLLTQMKFTRDMENAADQAAIEAVASMYGHVGGAAALFELLATENGASFEGTPDWLETFVRTHPTDRNRIRAINDAAVESGWSASGELTPLPDGFKDWL